MKAQPGAIVTKLSSPLYLGRAIRFVWMSAKGLTAANGFLLLIQGGLPMASLYLMKLTVDAVAAGVTSTGKANAFRQVLMFIALMGGTALASSLVRSIAGVVSEMQARVVTDHMSDALHAKSVEVDLSYYENPRFYDTLHRAQVEAPYRPTRIVNGLMQLGQNGVSLLAMIGLLWTLDWGVAAVMLLAVLPGLMVRIGFAGKLFRLQREQTATERRSAYFSRILTGAEYAMEVRLFGLAPFFMESFRDLRAKLRKDRLAIATRRSIAETAALGGVIVAVYGALAFIAYRAMQGTISLGDLVMYSQAFLRGQGFLQGVLGGLAALYEDNLFLSNMSEFLELNPTVVEPVHPRPIPSPIMNGIVLDRVRFRYPGCDRYVLEDVSIEIRPGETVALVGENGSGKTTLVKMLCRMYDPIAGAIRIDGIDLRECSTFDVRRGISVVLQDYARYHMSARENIRMGNIALPSDDPRIAASAADAGADAFLRTLPNGYDTILGKSFDQGEELSVGEWQKVALSRALLRDARILVLDEPTSSMDATSEEVLFGNFRRLAAGRIVVLITHRFSTVRMADRVFLLEGGRIVEQGTHEALVRSAGRYAHMFESQARHYR